MSFPSIFPSPTSVFIHWLFQQWLVNLSVTDTRLISALEAQLWWCYSLPPIFPWLAIASLVFRTLQSECATYNSRILTSDFPHVLYIPVYLNFSLGILWTCLRSPLCSHGISPAVEISVFILLPLLDSNLLEDNCDHLLTKYSLQWTVWDTSHPSTPDFLCCKVDITIFFR